MPTRPTSATHILSSATKKVDVAVCKTIQAAQGRLVSKFKTNFNAIFTVRNGGVGLREDLQQGAQPSWKKAVESVRKQIATGLIKVTAQAPPPG